MKFLRRWWAVVCARRARIELRVRRTRAQTWGQTYSMSEIRKKQLADADVGPILRWFESGKRPYGQDVSMSSPATRHYWMLWDTLSINEGVLCRKFHKKDATGQYVQLIVPKSIRDEVLYQMHTCILSGHLGRKKTQEKTLQRYYWYQLREDVNNWIAKCDLCGAPENQ